MKKFNSIDLRNGTEGPRHDPYSFTEITVHGRAGEVTIHAGLANWLRHNDKLITGEEKAALMFEKLTGLAPWTAEKIYHNLPLRRHRAKCDSLIFEEVSGYPGETFTICTKCRDVVDSHFNRSAVE